MKTIFIIIYFLISLTITHATELSDEKAITIIKKYLIKEPNKIYPTSRFITGKTIKEFHLEDVSIIKRGKFHKNKDYWPVRARIKANLAGTYLDTIMNTRTYKDSVDKIIETRLMINDFDEWEVDIIKVKKTPDELKKEMYIGSYLGYNMGAGGGGYSIFLNEETNKKIEITTDYENTTWYLDGEKVQINCDGGCFPDLPKKVAGCDMVMIKQAKKVKLDVESRICLYLDEKEREILLLKDRIVELIGKKQCKDLTKLITDGRYSCTNKQNSVILKALDTIKRNNYTGNSFAWGAYEYATKDIGITLRDSENKYGYVVDSIFPYSVFE